MKNIWKEFKTKIATVTSVVLLLQTGVTAQTGIPEIIQKQFEQARQYSLQEKLFVHTDKTFYVAGEIIWFKIYHADGYFHKPLELSKLAYVEILSKDQKPVLQAKIALEEGTGNGSFMIPFSLNSGNYLLRAYTSWMKNFDADYYFEKAITVVNTLKNPDWTQHEAVVKYDIQFFPEGGSLVSGIQSKVAFRITDQTGKGIDCSGVVVSQKNDTVARFQPLKFGIGNFRFIPVEGNTYKAHVKTPDGNIITKDLPAIYSKGYVMKVSFANNARISVTVSANNNSSNSPVYLFIHTRQLVKLVQMKEMKNGNAEFIVDENMLGEGVSHFTLFDEARQPVCERLYFKRPVKKLSVEVKMDSLEYSSRQQVKMELLTHDQGNHPVMADMSMSVFLLDSLQTIEQGDIFSYFWLTSDLKGTIESPNYYLNNSGAEVDEAIDNLMLTHGWRRFIWEDILQNKKPFFRFLPEYEGHIINGKVLDRRTGLPGKQIKSFLSVPGEQFRFASSVSNEEGQVRFIVKNFYGTDEIVVQTNYVKDSLYRIDIANPYSEIYSATTLPPFTLSEKIKGQLVSRSISTQVQNTFLSDKYHRIFLPATTDSTPFYGVSDKKYFLDDYTRFITMEEVMREFVPEVRIKKRSEKFYFEVKNIPTGLFLEDDPLVLLDGVPIFDVNKIVSFDPLKIKKLEVIARKYYHGSLENNGIVSYGTYKGDLGGFQLNPNALIVEYPGLQSKREFYSPIYDVNQQSDRLPDFRNVLFWFPDIKTDVKGKKELSFYTSEVPGKYAVVVQGTTSQGEAGSTILIFPVTNSAAKQ